MAGNKIFAKYGTVLLLGVVVILVLLYILHQPGSSPITRGIIAASQWAEGFTTTPTNSGSFSTSDNSCPPDYTFFNDSVGSSFCCRGVVDVYGHKCLSDNADDLCAMMPNVTDPRKLHKGNKLKTCSAIKKVLYSNANANFCLSTLPNYVSSNKCCKSGTNATGTDCQASDLADKSRYCVAGNTPPAQGSGEQWCYNLKLSDMTHCPSGMTKNSAPMATNTSFTQRYGASRTTDIVLPYCSKFGGGECIADEVITKLGTDKTLFGDKNIATWKYACGAYKRKYIDGDTTLALDESL